LAAGGETTPWGRLSTCPGQIDNLPHAPLLTANEVKPQEKAQAMSTLVFRGIDLSRAGWTLSQAVVDQEQGDFELRDSQPLPPELAAAFANVHDHLGVDGETLALEFPGDEKVPIRPIVQECCNKIDASTGSLVRFDKVGVAFPYGLSPTVRRVLPLLVHEKEDDLNGRYSALESPVVACLEMLATGRLTALSSGESVAFLGDAVGGAELTVIRLALADNQLKLEVLAWRELPLTADETAIDGRAGDWARHFTPPKQTPPCRLCILRPGLESVGEIIAVALGLPGTTVAVLNDRTVADGAARFAAMAVQGRLCVGPDYAGSEIRKVEVQRLCPRAVGILGGNRAGDWFWRRLFTGGTSLQAAATCDVEIGDGSLPPHVILAECASDRPDPPLWLPQSLWQDHGMRLCTLKSIQAGTWRGGNRKLRFTLRNPAGPLLWNNKTVEVTAVASNKGQ
jgi:hypothetical protein